jgi:2-methylcitrate dehydratase PrpD
MATLTPTIAEQLSEHITGLDYYSLPASVVERTKEALLDQLGCQIVGSTLGHCNIIYDFIKGFAGEPEATVVNRPLKTWAHDAALSMRHSDTRAKSMIISTREAVILALIQLRCR